jgi:hypothetical protein
MELTTREFWGLVHGMGFGGLFLLAFAGGLAGIYSLRPELITPTGIRERLFRLNLGATGMAIAAWGTVLTGTWIVYPWYRAKPPAGTTDLTDFPRYRLLASEGTAGWHEFAMEWKEHVAWFAPILATVVAFIVWRFGPRLAENAYLRKVVLVTFVLAFASAAIAGLFGALITKVAPII